MYQVDREMFYTSVKPILFEGNSRNCQSSSFELSNPLESIIDHFNGRDPACAVFHGEPGSGRTTFLSKFCDTLLERNLVKPSEIFAFRVRAGCSEKSLWDFVSGIANDRQDKDTASLLLQSSAELSQKYSAAQAFISSNYKLVCIDDVYLDDGFVWELLAKIRVHVIVVLTSREARLKDIQSTMTEHAVLSVELKGVGMDSFKQALSNKHPNWTFTDDELLRIRTKLNGNPTSLKLLTNAVNEFKLSQESFDYAEPLNEEESSSVLMVLQYVLQRLTVTEKQVLGQLCQSREPLPLRTVSEEIGKLVRLGLVDKEPISEDTTNNGICVYSISVACCIQLSSLKLIDPSDNDGLSIFDLWYGLLSEELSQLVNDAERNTWPFVPEKWQYIANVGAEERYNIKELITANSFVPQLTEQDILQECLFQAVKGEMYSKVAALVFVTDRFSYWLGRSRTTLRLVDYLRTNSPGTAIAPQLLIREARVMKNDGDLDGAERALDELLVNESQVGVWVYRETHDHQLVRAVCLQIKGDIHYNRGQWLQGAKLLIKSIKLFNSLPVPDTKGISSSLAILANCLEQMSTSEYKPFAKKHGLSTIGPLLQAYCCSCSAARRSKYTPLFYARNKCHAAEYMLRHALQTPSEPHRQKRLRIAAEDFMDSIQAHTDFQSLTSREEFYIFVCAVCKLGVTYKAMATRESIQQALLLHDISVALYEHYCSFTGSIILDKGITKVISRCLSILQLKLFCNAGAVLKVRHEEHSVDKRFNVNLRPSVFSQNLENDAVHVLCERFQGLNSKLDSGVQGAIVWKYDCLSNKWRRDKTLACVGDYLGAQRNACRVEFILQEDPSAKYVAKSYKKTTNMQRYRQDGSCQLIARHYAMLFNQKMNRAGANVGHIEFLPVVLLQLVNENGSLSGAYTYNVERHVAGEVVQLTNNLKFVREQGLVSDLVQAFSHFTYEASNQKLVIVGRTPASDETGSTFLFDPQIHSVVYKCFGTGNLLQEGIASFWKEMHPRCNNLCEELGLVKPNVAKSP